MLGFGWSELLIICVVLVCVIGLVAGVVVVVVSLLRRREAGRAHPPHGFDSDAPPERRRDA